MDLASNPLYDLPNSSDANSESTYTSSIDDVPPAVAMPTAAILQTVNIKSHIPVELDLADSNYAEWRCFFDAFIGKFGLRSHLSSPPTPKNRRDREWVMRDQCILSWLYNSVSKDVRALVRVPCSTAYTIRNSIHEQFRDNELHHAVYLEAEFCSLVQEDMDIAAYTGRLKQLADARATSGNLSERQAGAQHASWPQLQVPPRRSVIATENPPHTFLSARFVLTVGGEYDP
ncbi:unnamed protein product [Miscanthus lutarioriparius]|uniref:Retrotransposon Copia-like N-terminal domain-containing protein n=1 Tax=Miscanthus lutarioriparius TaxID=422564 RepID=A0A811QJ47_9POAL|nr:unnamed protein product [Miscanthus lutarioriparius]